MAAGSTFEDADVRFFSLNERLAMKAFARAALHGLMLVPVLMITLCLSACADPAAPRTVLGDEPSWASQVPVWVTLRLANLSIWSL